MKLEVGISLIVVCTIIPVILFFIIRRIRANRLKRLLRGEVFDKEGERLEIVEEGVAHKI